MTIYLVVGLPGAGKTTRAKELEVSESALRLTPDDWYKAIFSGYSSTRWRSSECVEQRDHIEGRLIDIGIRAAELGLDVVLDLGLWSVDERSALRWIAHSLGVPAQIVYLPIDEGEQRRRVAGRYRSGTGEFRISDAELTTWRAQFEEPNQDELRGGPIPPVPAGYDTWGRWASERWPSLPDR